MSGKKALERFPRLNTDAEVEAFVDEADLSRFDLSGFQPMRFEFKPKTATVSMRMPQGLLEALKARATQEGIPYQRLIRRTLEQSLATKRSR